MSVFVRLAMLAWLFVGVPWLAMDTPLSQLILTILTAEPQQQQCSKEEVAMMEPEDIGWWLPLLGALHMAALTVPALLLMPGPRMGASLRLLERASYLAATQSAGLLALRALGMVRGLRIVALHAAVRFTLDLLFVTRGPVLLGTRALLIVFVLVEAPLLLLLLLPPAASSSSWSQSPSHLLGWVFADTCSEVVLRVLT